MAAVWAVACGTGLTVLTRYGSTPGPSAPAADWPAAAGVVRASDADTLVLAIHPKCPCSRATISNLAVLMGHCPPGRMAAVALFVRPAGVAAGWERTGLWDAAAAIPGVTVVADDGGRRAAAFGAATSGQAIVFDPAGRCLFRGGLTPGRGHAGDCGGTDAVLALANGEAAAVDATPVFGCPLSAPAAAGQPGGTQCHR